MTLKCFCDFLFFLIVLFYVCLNMDGWRDGWRDLWLWHICIVTCVNCDCSARGVIDCFLFPVHFFHCVFQQKHRQFVPKDVCVSPRTIPRGGEAFSFSLFMQAGSRKTVSPFKLNRNSVRTYFSLGNLLQKVTSFFFLHLEKNIFCRI